jgi:2-polyprenyl-6-hydroxyphenyl methylase/3-demethylubiquinone-9 3-methyltransferase
VSEQTDDAAVKARVRAMWAAGDFPRVARETVPQVGPALVAAAGVRTGDRVLDVGAGAGATAIPAALAGGDVVASDLTPELLAAGRSAAVAAGVALEWVEADAEALPFADAAFDVVLSSFGAMFAWNHQAVADELVRVTRPGGRIAMANWTPEGWVGQFFMTMVPFMPSPPAGALPPIMWGVEDHVRELFGTRVSDLTFTRRVQVMDIFDDPAAMVAYYREHFGPTVMAYASVADDPERRAALDATFLDFATRSNSGAPGGRARYEMEHVLVVARRA